MLPDTSSSRSGRRLLKRLMYSQFSVLEFFTILAGKTQPRVPFTVKAQPSSVYFNFEILPSKLKAFENYVNLPEGFSLCPMRCLATERKGRYLLTLNTYEVTGISEGLRAEWSSYVLDEHGTPRYMVLEAESARFSMDPVDIVTRRSRVEHAADEDLIDTLVGSQDGKLFQASVRVSDADNDVQLHREWIEANDYIYWRNGICDRVFYDSGLANPHARIVPSAQAEISNNTHWAPFIKKMPVHIVQIANAIEFVIEPWSNV